MFLVEKQHNKYVLAGKLSFLIFILWRCGRVRTVASWYEICYNKINSIICNICSFLHINLHRKKLQNRIRLYLCCFAAFCIIVICYPVWTFSCLWKIRHTHWIVSTKTSSANWEIFHHFGELFNLHVTEGICSNHFTDFINMMRMGN